MKTKRQPKQPQDSQTPVQEVKVKEKPVEIKRVIPQEVLLDFVGETANLYKIDSTHIFEDKFRVNVWTKVLNKTCVIPGFSLFKSFFVLYNGLDVVDETIQTKLNPMRVRY